MKIKHIFENHHMKTLQSYCGDGIGTIKPTLGKGMDPYGWVTNSEKKQRTRTSPQPPLVTFSPVFQQSYRITLRDASLENVEMERVIDKQLE